MPQPHMAITPCPEERVVTVGDAPQTLACELEQGHTGMHVRGYRDGLGAAWGPTILNLEWEQ